MTGRQRTCAGYQDTSLEVHPHSRLWRDVTQSLGETEVPDVYTRDSGRAAVSARSGHVGHGALAPEVTIELITPLAKLDVS